MVAGADPGFFLGGGALVSCSTTSTPINHIVYFFLQNTSCIRKPQVISGRGGGGAHPLHLPPRSAPGLTRKRTLPQDKNVTFQVFFLSFIVIFLQLKGMSCLHFPNSNSIPHMLISSERTFKKCKQIKR